MEVEFTLKAQEDLAFWKKTNNVANLKKIRKLIESIIETPFEGIALKHNLASTWSRRIDREHRLVYVISKQLITVLSLKGHY